ncbi:MAG TPA: phenylalanine--tRNA ligase beta subunit-related protein [Baekduia sp.]|uniref:phenylalanine--tRNA ligase beta subunit-related protein n=1 Tax=Baekduia sp. TaxID=2600305 RepID=UPI002D76E5D7|nr:phenylalanine--tRNA ligase beta subunit-related protein [Baekduia sp.]HET6508344.1 phenylalanine--tRNA ligase beta subunit-related protein [Baekduia sp.]
MSGDDPREGLVDAAVLDELPGLRLRWALVAVEGGHKTPRGLRLRLEDVSTRFRGANAIQLRTRPVPHAYRVFFRQVGLDPDVERTPVEQLAVERLIRGELHTGDRFTDALVLGLLETGVPIVAFDEAALEGEVTLRAARAGETLPAEGGYAHDVPRGRLVLADGAGPVAVLFGRRSSAHGPHRRTAAVRLVAIAVPGVPEVHVDEALWLAAEGLGR